VLLASGCFHLFVAAKSNFPNRNGCEVGALVFPDASMGYGRVAETCTDSGLNFE